MAGKKAFAGRAGQCDIVKQGGQTPVIEAARRGAGKETAARPWQEMVLEETENE